MPKDRDLALRKVLTEACVITVVLIIMSGSAVDELLSFVQANMFEVETGRVWSTVKAKRNRPTTTCPMPSVPQGKPEGGAGVNGAEILIGFTGRSSVKLLLLCPNF